MSSTSTADRPPTSIPVEPTVFRPIPDRGITSDTAKFFGVGITTNQDGTPNSHFYPYYDERGNFLGNKVRRCKDKEFFAEGPIKKSTLFGANKFPAGSARQITVVEGELDALSAFQMQGSKYPVVSLRDGITGAPKEIANNFEYLNSFEQIVICFDNDKPRPKPDGTMHRPGQEYAELVASMLPHGKVRVLTLRDYKDPNDYLVRGKVKQFQDEWWQAPMYVPAGIIMARDTLDELLKPRKFDTIPYQWESLNKMTYGIRLSELVVITAETGIGKSTLLNEIQYPILMNQDCIESGKGLGLLRLEETKVDTCLGMLSLACNKPLHLPDVRESVTEDELRKLFDTTLNNDRVVIWDHFGSNSIDVVLDKITHMAALGCKYIILDHLSIIVSDQEGGDERKQLDAITTKLKTLCMQLNIAVFAVIHQNRAGQIRGTAGVEQLANIVMKLHRDKTDACPIRRSITKIVIEKNRFCGRTGPATYLWYNEETGRLVELTNDQIGVYEAGGTPNMEQWDGASEDPVFETDE